MKIKKTLISTEIDITVDELQHIRTLHPNMQAGLIIYLRKTFGLDLYKVPKPIKKDENTTDSQ